MKYKEVIMRYIPYITSVKKIQCVYVYGLVCHIVKYIMTCVCFLYIASSDI